MKTSSRCNHQHTFVVSEIEPFLVKGSYGNKDIWVDSVTMNEFDDAASVQRRVVGHGYYARANGEPGLVRAASYSGARIAIGDLPADVREALLAEIKRAEH